jgi:hypothetical protein
LLRPRRRDNNLILRECRRRSGDEQQGDANPITNREKLRKITAIGRRPPGTLSRVHLAISLSPPYLFGEKQRREDPSGSPLTAAQHLPRSHPLDEQRRRWGRRGGGDRRCGGESRRGRAVGTNPQRCGLAAKSTAVLGPSVRQRSPAAPLQSQRRRLWEGLLPLNGRDERSAQPVQRRQLGGGG